MLSRQNNQVSDGMAKKYQKLCMYGVRKREVWRITTYFQRLCVLTSALYSIFLCISASLPCHHRLKNDWTNESHLWALESFEWGRTTGRYVRRVRSLFFSPAGSLFVVHSLIHIHGCIVCVCIQPYTDRAAEDKVRYQAEKAAEAEVKRILFFLFSFIMLLMIDLFLFSPLPHHLSSDWMMTIYICHSDKPSTWRLENVEEDQGNSVLKWLYLLVRRRRRRRKGTPP